MSNCIKQIDLAKSSSVQIALPISVIAQVRIFDLPPVRLHALLEAYVLFVARVTLRTPSEQFNFKQSLNLNRQMVHDCELISRHDRARIRHMLVDYRAQRRFGSHCTSLIYIFLICSIELNHV